MNKPAATLAVDGGGSKIDAALLAADGGLIAATRRDEPVSQGMNGDEQHALAATVAELCSLAGVDTSGDGPVAEVGVFCLAGADLPVDVERLTEAIAAKEWTRDLLIENDTMGILRAGTDRGWGVAVACGAGLNVTGVHPDGRVARFPALGRLSGDWASGGSWLGTEALGASLRGVDGRGPHTALEQLVPAYFKIDGPMKVVEAVYTGKILEDRLAELPPVVVGAARDGDIVALDMLERLAIEIVAWVGAAIRNLDMRTLDVQVVLGGGLMRNAGDAFVE